MVHMYVRSGICWQADCRLMIVGCSGRQRMEKLANTSVTRPMSPPQPPARCHMRVQFRGFFSSSHHHFIVGVVTLSGLYRCADNYRYTECARTIEVRDVYAVHTPLKDVGHGANSFGQRTLSVSVSRGDVKLGDTARKTNVLRATMLHHFIAAVSRNTFQPCDRAG